MLNQCILWESKHCQNIFRLLNSVDLKWPLTSQAIIQFLHSLWWIYIPHMRLIQSVILLLIFIVNRFSNFQIFTLFALSKESKSYQWKVDFKVNFLLTDFGRDEVVTPSNHKCNPLNISGQFWSIHVTHLSHSFCSEMVATKHFRDSSSADLEVSILTDEVWQ